MPEITAGTKIILGSIAAGAALVTGLLGNILASNIAAFFSGQPPKTGKRPVILWAAFFVAASLSVVAGSITTFAPTAPTPAPEKPPKVVVTNLSAALLRQEPRGLFIICRDTVEIANTSDIPTSVVAVGSDVQLDGTEAKLEAAPGLGSWSNEQATVQARAWRTAPPAKKYANTHNLDQFAAVLGDALPVRVEAHSTTTVVLDYAAQFTTTLPQKITASHVLRFPDLADLNAGPVECR